MTELEPHEFVLNLEHAVWQAVVRKDGAALSELLADNYIEITLDGRRVEKSDTVNESPQVDEIDAYVIDAEKVVWLGEDRAIHSYHLTLDGRCRGVTISPRDRWATSVWSRFDNKWLCCFFQQSAFVAEHNDRSSPLQSSQEEAVAMVANDCAEVLARRPVELPSSKSRSESDC